MKNDPTKDIVMLYLFGGVLFFIVCTIALLIK